MGKLASYSARICCTWLGCSGELCKSSARAGGCGQVGGGAAAGAAVAARTAECSEEEEGGSSSIMEGMRPQGRCPPKKRAPPAKGWARDYKHATRGSAGARCAPDAIAFTNEVSWRSE
jgi:hypothetical protein